MRRQGFTIVELLIVIVVIAALAAITIVAFNGIQKRAQTSSVSSSLSNATKKIKLYQVDNGNYPSALADAGVTDGATTYQYSGTATTYCITGTQGSTSLFVSNTQSTPTAGGCAGHGQGGVAALTNLATNPKPTAGSPGGYGGWPGVGGATSLGVYNDSSLGRTVWRMTWTTGSTSNGGSYWQSDPVIIPGVRYQISQTIRSSKNQTVTPLIVWVNAAASAETGNASMGATSLTAGVSQRIGASGVAPPGTGRMRIIAYSNSAKWEAGNTLDTWDTLVVQTDNTGLYNYADGSSPNWVWNGAAHASTSTGPPV